MIKDLSKKEELYIVSCNWTWDYEESDVVIELFKNKKKALEFYYKQIEDEKNTFEDKFDKKEIEIEDLKYNDNTLSYTLSQKGDYTRYHSLIKIWKQEINM